MLMLVLLTWSWTTAASALVLLTVIGLQRLLVGRADEARRQRPAVQIDLTQGATVDLRERTSRVA